MTLTARNDMPDWAVRETASAKAHRGTHLAPDAGSGALFVSRGTGTLGDGQGALDVRAGAALVDGDRQSRGSETPVDIRTGGGEPRRDVVYLTVNGTLAVLEGAPAPFEWGDGIGREQQTIANAHRPAPPDMADVAGYPLAVVTVTANANSLSTQAIHELRAPAPVGATAGGGAVRSSDYGTIQAALDEAAGEELLIDDTKTEEGIGLRPVHSDTTIRCVGGHGIRQPASSTPGTPVIGRDKSIGGGNPVYDVTFVDLNISNPSVSDADIQNEDTLPGGDRTDGFAWQSGSPVSYAHRFEFIRPHIHHVQGHGIGCSFTQDAFTVRDGYVHDVAFDAYYARSYGGPPGTDGPVVTYDGCYAADCGRHNFCVAGNAGEARFHVSGVGKRAYTAGIDVEDGYNATIDATIHESGRATSITGNNSDLHSGMYVANGSGPPTGRLKVINPHGCAVTLKAGAKDLSVVVEHDSPGHPNDLPDVRLDRVDVADETTAADITCNINGGGCSKGSIQVYETSNARIEATVADVSGPAAVFSDGSNNQLDLAYENVCTAGGGSQTADAVVLDADGAATGTFHTGAIRDFILDLNGDAANVQHAVSGSGDVDYTLVRGNVRTGYAAASSTSGLGANSNVSGLLD